ncbi:MAG: cation:proton antiporter regulatory subunit [Rubrobacter sp.]|nr:cation:proton antiporter regulatory subunit [Rubrobacter sp.]
MDIKETDLPGIGRKFQTDTREGERLVIVVHDDGRRELYQFEKNNYEECSASVTLDDTEARQLSGILGGMTYKPRALENVEVAFDDLVIEWYRVSADSEARNKTIGELEIRQRFGVSVIAIIHDDRNKSVNPGPEAVIDAGCTVVASGEREQMNRLREFLS